MTERDDIKFLMSFVPEGLKGSEEIPKDLPPMFYHTLSWEGDVELAKKVEEIQVRLDEGCRFKPGY